MRLLPNPGLYRNIVRRLIQHINIGSIRPPGRRFKQLVSEGGEEEENPAPGVGRGGGGQVKIRVQSGFREQW
jgi:hypothetical protein